MGRFKPRFINEKSPRNAFNTVYILWLRINTNGTTYCGLYMWHFMAKQIVYTNFAWVIQGRQ